MTKLVLGAFADRTDADKAIKELQDAGVPNDDFSVIGKGETDVPVGAKESIAKSVDGGTAAEGAAIGGATGGLDELGGGKPCVLVGEGLHQLRETLLHVPVEIEVLPGRITVLAPPAEARAIVAT